MALAHLPLPWIPGETFQMPFLYISGKWFAILLGAAFIGVMPGASRKEGRQSRRRWPRRSWSLAREQHLSQIDGLAAAAAHELGTPLATITVVAKSSPARPADTETAEDLALFARSGRALPRHPRQADLAECGGQTRVFWSESPWGI